MSDMYQHYKIALDWAYALGNGHARDCDSRGFSLAIGGGVVAVVGHSDGESMEGTSPEDVGEEILSLPGFDATHKVILCACNTGRGSFASRLSRKLQSAGKRVEIMAPNEPTNRITAAGPAEWVVDPHGGIDWRDVGNWTLIF